MERLPGAPGMLEGTTTDVVFVRSWLEVSTFSVENLNSGLSEWDGIFQWPITGELGPSPSWERPHLFHIKRSWHWGQGSGAVPRAWRWQPLDFISGSSEHCLHPTSGGVFSISKPLWHWSCPQEMLSAEFNCGGDTQHVKHNPSLKP